VQSKIMGTHTLGMDQIPVTVPWDTFLEKVAFPSPKYLDTDTGVNKKAPTI
jgi:hypothetical protein